MSLFKKVDPEVQSVLDMRKEYLNEIYNDLESVSDEDIEKNLKELQHSIEHDENVHYYLLQAGQQVLGVGFLTVQSNIYSIAYPYKKKAVINGLYVSPKYRGNGFGSNILNELVELAENLKVQAIELETNIPKFYEENGFVRISPAETLSDIKMVKVIKKDKK